MKNLGINEISKSNDGKRREVVFLSPAKGVKSRGAAKGLPKVQSVTFHQWKVNGDWYPPKPL